MPYKIIHAPEFNEQILKLFNKKQRIIFISFEKMEVWMLSAMHKKDAEKHY